MCYEETELVIAEVVMADPEHGDGKLSWRLEVKKEDEGKVVSC